MPLEIQRWREQFEAHDCNPALVGEGLRLCAEYGITEYPREIRRFLEGPLAHAIEGLRREHESDRLKERLAGSQATFVSEDGDALDIGWDTQKFEPGGDLTNSKTLLWETLFGRGRGHAFARLARLDADRDATHVIESARDGLERVRSANEAVERARRAYERAQDALRGAEAARLALRDAEADRERVLEEFGGDTEEAGKVTTQDAARRVAKEELANALDDDDGHWVERVERRADTLRKQRSAYGRFMKRWSDARSRLLGR